ncbi:hypothetical protein RB601_000635 [Gaeumannomyces tritici]
MIRDTPTIRHEDLYPQDPQCSYLKHFHPQDEDAWARADVIFVAGLGGNFIGTWEAEDKTVWPRDLLPNHVKGIRIRSFAYNTTLFGTTGELGLRNHANELVWKILEEREDDEAAMLRPLVFVGHSLGGLLIKRALKEAYDKPRLRPIWEASRGIMFFASPQYDMDSLAWPTFSDRVLRSVAPRHKEGQVPTQRMLEELAKNRPCMMNIGTDFKPLQPQLSYATLLEGDNIDGYDMVLVSPAHGLIHDPLKERHSMMSGDHLALCKFAKEEGEEASFGIVSEYIEWLLAQTPKEIDTLKHSERRALFSLCAEEFHLFFLDREATPNTCAWIVDTTEFKDWLHDTSSKKHKLWINGPPGCGKSYLARHIIVNKVIDRESHEVIHCFLGRSAPGHSTLGALLRSTPHQALRAAPRLVGKFLLPMFEEGQRRNPSDQNVWSEGFLVGMWADAMAEVTALRPLAFVIDGLDEMDEQCRTGFLARLRELEAKSRSLATKSGSAEPKFKLLLLSREDPQLEVELSSLGFVSRRVTPEDTKEDVERTVAAGLATFWKIFWVTTCENLSGADRMEIYDIIIRQSGDTYLCAALVVQYLCRIRMKSKADLKRKIKELPRDIGGLYGKMVEQLFSRTRFVPFAKQALSWAMFQRRRLKTAEFNVAQALGLALDKHKGPNVPTHEELQEFLEDSIEIKQDHCCGHLVKFQGGRMEWAHGSLLLYLLEQGGEGSILAGRGIDKHASHAAMAQACITYLNMGYFANSGAPREPGRMDLWEAKVRRLVKKHPFVRYAALNWRSHLEDAGAAAWRAHSGTPESHARSVRWREQLLSGDSEHAKSWSEVWWFFTRGPSEDYPDRCLTALAAAHRKAAPDLDMPWTASPGETELEAQEEALDSRDATPSPQAISPSSDDDSPLPEPGLLLSKVMSSGSGTTSSGSEDGSTLFKVTSPDPEAMSLSSESGSLLTKATSRGSGNTVPGSEAAAALSKIATLNPESMPPSSTSAWPSSKMASSSSGTTAPGAKAASIAHKIPSIRPKAIPPSSGSAWPSSKVTSPDPEATSPSPVDMSPISGLPSSTTRGISAHLHIPLPALGTPPQAAAADRDLGAHYLCNNTRTHHTHSQGIDREGTDTHTTILLERPDTNTTTQLQGRDSHTVTQTNSNLHTNTKKNGWRQRVKKALKGVGQAGKLLVNEALVVGPQDRKESEEIRQEITVTRY